MYQTPECEHVRAYACVCVCVCVCAFPPGVSPDPDQSRRAAARGLVPVPAATASLEQLLDEYEETTGEASQFACVCVIYILQVRVYVCLFVCVCACVYGTQMRIRKVRVQSMRSVLTHVCVHLLDTCVRADYSACISMMTNKLNEKFSESMSIMRSAAHSNPAIRNDPVVRSHMEHAYAQLNQLQDMLRGAQAAGTGETGETPWARIHTHTHTHTHARARAHVWHGTLASGLKPVTNLCGPLQAWCGSHGSRSGSDTER